ncbi:terpenoid synthase [Chiua virens]|nr:terpenoid synthase [Chiua virens]
MTLVTFLTPINLLSRLFPALAASPPTPTTIRLPDLVSHCKFDLHIDRSHKRVSVESMGWLFDGDPDLDEPSRRAFHGVKAGKLAAMCYPNVGYPQLRACTDFLNWLIHLDNLSDDMTDRSIENVAEVVMNSLHQPYTYHSPGRLSRMTTDIGGRIIQTASPGTVQRFLEGMDLFFRAVQQQARDRASGILPSVETYVALRRDTSGCKPCVALIEYAHHLHIPDDVMGHPILQRLTEGANDVVTWVNDIVSYDVEQSKGHTHNLINIVMQEHGLTVQDAINMTGDFCDRAMDQFLLDRANLPSWGPVIDAEVRVYVSGLEDWMVGSLHWSYETERYFGKAGQRIKKTGILTLRPKVT